MYELLKQLKDAGFPQNLFKGRVINRDNEEIIAGYRFKDENDVVVYEPTTDELIDELGSDLKTLSRYEDGSKWIANFWPIKNAGKPNTNIEGSTPKEALIKLYIELHNENSTT